MSLYNDITRQDNGPVIRLLVLLPSQRSSHNDSPIECILMVISLADAEGDYEALSYCWGAVAATRTIRCNGQDVEVTQNLHDALQHLRQTNLPRRLWIDALCVDQHNPAERQAQVGFMRDIYHGAERVLIWLGVEADHSPRVFALCKRMIEKRGAMLDADDVDVTSNDFLMVPTKERLDRQLEIMVALAAAKEHGQAEGSAESEEEVAEDLKSKENGSLERWLDRMRVRLNWKMTDPKQGEIDAFLALLRRPYWTRVWIVQEVCLAREAVVLCGRDSMDFSTLITGFVLVMIYGKMVFSQQPEEVCNFGLVQLLDTRRTRSDWFEAVEGAGDSDEDEGSDQEEDEEKDGNSTDDGSEWEDYSGDDGDGQAGSDVDEDETLRGEQTSTRSHTVGGKSHNETPSDIIASTESRKGDRDESESQADIDTGDEESDNEEEASNNDSIESEDDDSQPEPIDLLALLWDYRPHDATDPRDKVYALLGLLLPPDITPAIKADYTLSLAECYAGVARALIAQTHTLDVLKTPAPHGDDRVPIPGLPSWAPDWRGGKRRDITPALSQEFDEESPGVPTRKWAAAGAASDSIRTTGTDDESSDKDPTVGSSDKGTRHNQVDQNAYDPCSTKPTPASPSLPAWFLLVLSGHITDSIELLAPVLPNMTADVASISNSDGLAALRIAADVFTLVGFQIETWLQWESLALSQREPYAQTGESLLDAYFSTITTCDFPRGRECARKAFDQWRGWLATPSLLRRWIGSGVHGMRETGQRLWRRAGLITSAVSHVFTGVDDAGTSALLMSCPIRRFAVTRRGRFALVPAQTCSGDEVALLRGSRVPVVVRRAGAQWEVVGAAYVHGIMFGEAWDEALALDMEFV